MTPDERWERAKAVSQGRIPPGVEPDSDEGRRYARMAAVIRANLKTAPPLTDEQRRFIGALLGGGDLRESA